MTDVRLTATNPEDSSVVPVACNSRGELLVTEPIIEQISNALTVEGKLTIKDPERPTSEIVFNPPGNALFARNAEGSNAGEVTVARSSEALMVVPFTGDQRWKVFWNGNMQVPSLKLQLEASNPDHYTLSTKDGESDKEYTGPTLDVGEELQFLRAQVKSLMERLKMTPEGGWPVWDGSE